MQWPPVRVLKDLQAFLGTLNHIRPFCGPEFSRVMHPLRVLLKPEAAFPPNLEQEKAITGLKQLCKDLFTLCVPDEAAAILAAQAWMAGAPPAGRPYEGGVDTSKIAMGGVLGQPKENNGPMFVLMLWSAPLSDSQSNWHPSEQECWGLVQFKRETVKHFGRIPMIMHTDHANIVRIESLPLERVDAKHY